MNISTAAESSGQAAVEVDRLIRCGCGDPDSHNGLRCRHGTDENCDFCFRPCPVPCGCGNPASHNTEDAILRRPCPKPRAASFQGERLGNVGFTHKSRLVRWADWLLRGTGHRYTLWVAPENSAKVICRSMKGQLDGRGSRVRFALFLILWSGHRLVDFSFSESADADTIRRGAN